MLIFTSGNFHWTPTLRLHPFLFTFILLHQGQGQHAASQYLLIIFTLIIEVIQLKKVSLHLEKSLQTPTLLFLHYLFIFTPLLLQSGHHWMGKRRGLDQRSSHYKLHVVTVWEKYFWGGREISFGRFFSALNPCVVCHNRKESSDSKPPSQKKTSDHLKKERSAIWELFCLVFVLEK